MINKVIIDELSLKKFNIIGLYNIKNDIHFIENFFQKEFQISAQIFNQKILELNQFLDLFLEHPIKTFLKSEERT